MLFATFVAWSFGEPSFSADRNNDNFIAREMQSDPYRPNVLPGEARQTTPGAVITFGNFTSVQVNVDSNGMNVVGDAANEPSIAIDPTNPNRIVIGWRQFDSILSSFRQAGWGYSQDAGQSWTFPGVIEPGVFRSDPVLGVSPDGVFYFYSLETSPNYNCTMFRSFDGGISWDNGVYAFGGDKAWFTVDHTNGPGRGNIYAFWSRFASCCSGDFTRSIDDGDSFMTPIAYSSNSNASRWGTMTVAPDGTLYSVSSSGVIGKSSDAQISGTTPTFQLSSAPVGGGGTSGAPNPGGLSGQPWIAADHSYGSTSGNIYVLGYRNTFPDPLDLYFTSSTDGAQTWNTRVRVNDDPMQSGAWQWFGSMSVAPNGRIDVTWNDTRESLGSGQLSQVYYAYSFDGGGKWSKNIPLTPIWNSHIGWPQQSKIGDYYHMVSDNEGANLAYAATFNGEQDVYFLRILRDCNENSTPDEVDIAQGTSPDCNDNLYPDECEDDCNLNGQPDDCDLALGSSVDCDSNLNPDECDIDENSSAPGGPYYCTMSCAADCNENGIIDSCDIASCMISEADCDDCNSNEIPDSCDIATGGSQDTDQNLIPDECQVCTHVIAATIPPCGFDARQPHEPESVLPAQGLTTLEITFESGCFAHTIDQYFHFVDVHPTVTQPPVVLDVTSAANELVVQLDRPLAKNAWNCIGGHCIGFFPGNVDESSLAGPSDTLQIVGTLQGLQTRPLHQTDINRSGELTAEDLIRHLDLVYGAGTFASIQPVQIPFCPNPP